MKFGIVYYWRDPLEIFLLAQDFMEIRVFENDIEDGYSKWYEKLKELRKDWDDDVTIHMPEYFNDPITGNPVLVDLASDDDRIYELSIDIIRSLIEFAETIDAAKIIVHPGGISRNPPKGRQTEKIEKLTKSLITISDLNFSGEILLENMPWFYWMGNKSRWYSNICMVPDDFSMLLPYCDGLVLDLSHGFLSQSMGSNDYLEEYADKYRDRIHYVHVSDALPPDNEGLQIGEGNTNFEGIFNLLEKEKLWLVPEIWKGHENFGEGFQIAIERINDLL